MKFYSNVLFPRFCNFVMDQPLLAKHRRELLADVSGDILEIGLGTGLNLPHYPDHVRKLTTVDPNAGMSKMAQKRIDRTGIQVDKRVLSSESLPFDDGAFDCVVSTWTLCSIQNVGDAMKELYRVLRPGGRMLFIEHGVSIDVKICRWQRRLNWLQKRIGDGCRLDLDVRSLMSEQPFDRVEIDEFYMQKTPKTHGYTYRGVATK